MQRRRLALLVLLASARYRPVPRDRLIGLFWPDHPCDDARHALAQLVYGIRQSLGEETLVSGPDDLRLNAALVSADIAEFDEAVENGELERAVSLATGPYLESFYISDAPEFERWCESERLRHRTKLLDACVQLARSATRAGNMVEAAHWWRRRLQLDPLDVTATTELMRALAAHGDVAAALQQARIHEALMRQELDAEPQPAVIQLASELRLSLNTETEATKTSVNAAPLAAPAAPTHGRTQRWRPPTLTVGSARIAAFVVGMLAVLTGLTAFGMHLIARPAAVGPPRRVVLGDVTGPDTMLDLAVREAIRAQLESTHGVQLLSDDATRQTLALMRLPSSAELTEARTIHVAQRAGAPLAVLASVRPLGNGLQLVARIVDAGGQGTLASFVERADSPAHVMAAVSSLTIQLGRGITGVRATADVAALPAITTASLAALKDYALARRSRGWRDFPSAQRYLESALDEDSTFALAQYLLADVLWFEDHEQQAEARLSRALELSSQLAPRERMIVRARYEQLVADRPDSAIAEWQRLIAAAPYEPLGYEGLSWAFRALGDFAHGAAAADTALRIDSLALLPNATNRLYALIDAGDTTTARLFARRMAAKVPFLERYGEFQIALRARDWNRAYATTLAARAVNDPYSPAMEHVALLAQGQLQAARFLLDSIRGPYARAQVAPRGLLLQGWSEVQRGGARIDAARYARDALAWIDAADLSAPAVARLTERAAELGARAGDLAIIEAARQLLDRRDAGRGLRSYRIAGNTVRAAAAFTRGDARTAADLARSARQDEFFGRSTALIAMLEADSRAAMGDTSRARELYVALLTPKEFAGGDVETWAVVQPIAGERLRAMNSVNIVH